MITLCIKERAVFRFEKAFTTFIIQVIWQTKNKKRSTANFNWLIKI